jgi:hypothetical protein
MQQVDREGYFRGTIQVYLLEQSEKTGTYNLSIQVLFDEHYYTDPATNETGWVGWPYEHGAYGYLNLVKKDQKLNDINMTNLIEHAGWDGNFESMGNNTWQPQRCGFKVKTDTYKDVTSFKVDGVNSLDFTPGEKSKAKVNPQAGSDLNKMFGSQVRALASSLKRNATPPTTPKPPSPPPAPKREAIPAHAELEVPVNADGQEVPF